MPDPADHSKLELIKGVLYVSPPPEETHHEAFAGLIKPLIGEMDRCGYRGGVYSARAAIWIDDDTYLEPDMIYVSDELKSQMKSGHWTKADIVVEIISPSNAEYDRRTKSDTYRAMGVREMWLVDAYGRQVEVRSFESGNSAIYTIEDTLRSEVLPEIAIPVFTLFN